MSDEEQKSVNKKAVTLKNIADSIGNQSAVYDILKNAEELGFYGERFADEFTKRIGITSEAAQVVGEKLLENAGLLAANALGIEWTKLQIVEDAEKYKKLFENNPFFNTTYDWLEKVKDSAGDITFVNNDSFLADIARATGMTESELSVIEASTQEIILPVAPLDNTPEIQSLIEEVRQLNEKVALQQAEIDRLKAERERETADTNPKRGANRGTIGKIKRLAAYRQESISQGRGIPGWMNACGIINVDPRLVTTHAPELRENWEDKTYVWENPMNLDSED